MPEELLPVSIREIHEINDLNLNISRGEFFVSLEDFDVFLEKLVVEEVKDIPFVNWNSVVNKYLRKGRTALYYTDTNGMDWVFFCNAKKLHCYYKGWRSAKSRESRRSRLQKIHNNETGDLPY